MMVVPVLETPDGQVIQDTSEMIDHFEARLPQPLMIPDTPVQGTVAGCSVPFDQKACWRRECTTAGLTERSTRTSFVPSSVEWRIPARTARHVAPLANN